LSSWERAQRTLERETERQRAASQRRAERLAASSDRARERELKRLEREHERARKVAAKQESAEVAQREVELARTYLEALSSFHRRRYQSREALSEFEMRLTRREYLGNSFVARPFVERWVPRGFEITPFQPPKRFPDTPHASRLAAASIFAAALPVVLGIGVGSVVGDLTTGAYAGLGGVALGGALWFAARQKTHRAFAAEMETASREHSAAEELRRIGFEAAEVVRRAEFDARAKAFNQAEWERHAAFDRHESAVAESARRGEQERIDVLLAARDGDVAAQMKVLEAALPLEIDLSSPPGFVGAPITDYEVGFRAVGGRRVEIVVLAPDMDIVPDKQVELSANGEKVKAKVIPEKERLAIYNRVIGSLALAHALRVLTVLPNLEAVDVEAGAMVLDGSTGRPVERVVIRAKFTPGGLDAIEIERVDPVEVLRRFEHEVAPLGGKAVVAPRLDRDGLTWASRDDDLLDVPYGLVPEQDNTRLPANPHG